MRTQRAHQAFVLLFFCLPLTSTNRQIALTRMDQVSNCLPISAPLLASPDLICDYVPFLLAMVRFDDLHEEAWNEAMRSQASAATTATDLVKPSSRRRSRRLNQDEPEPYIRYLHDLDDQQLDSSKQLMLRFGGQVLQEGLRDEEEEALLPLADPPLVAVSQAGPEDQGVSSTET